MSKLEAIVEGGKLRLRPILITKLTTILGLLPMALGIGEGAEVRAPMAITVIGGVLLTTFLTLLVIPGRVLGDGPQAVRRAGTADRRPGTRRCRSRRWLRNRCPCCTRRSPSPAP